MDTATIIAFMLGVAAIVTAALYVSGTTKVHPYYEDDDYCTKCRNGEHDV